MSTRTLGLMMGFAVMLAGSTASAGQHDEHQAATADGQATAQVAQCRQAQPRVAATIAAALKRLDDARQTNSPALMRAADQLHAKSVIDDAVWSTLKSRYDENQLMDVVVTVGQYNLVSWYLNTLGTPFEEGVAPYPMSAR